MVSLPSPYSVTRGQIVARGLTNCCPNCGARTLFKPGTLFQVSPECTVCGLKIERAADEEFFLGSLSLNYRVTIVGFHLPVMLLAWNKVITSPPTAARVARARMTTGRTGRPPVRLRTGQRG